MSGEANHYVAELRAENARLRAVVQRVEGLAERFSWDTWPEPDWTGRQVAVAIRGALNASTPAEPSTDTGPASAGAYSGVQGAGDGV